MPPTPGAIDSGDEKVTGGNDRKLKVGSSHPDAPTKKLSIQPVPLASGSASSADEPSNSDIMDTLGKMMASMVTKADVKCMVDTAVEPVRTEIAALSQRADRSDVLWGETNARFEKLEKWQLSRNKSNRKSKDSKKKSRNSRQTVPK